MGLFRRRRETLNEQLLRQAGLDPAQVLGDPAPTPPPEPSSPALAATLGTPHGLSAHHLNVGPNEWDAAVTVAAPDLAGDRIEFTTIPDGDVIVSEEAGDADLSPLADAVERRLSPPYRAIAARQEGDLWAVGAKGIEVARIPFPDGDKLTLAQHGADRELRVDDEPSDAPVPLELERLGEGAGADFYVETERIDGDLWEVRVTAL